MRKETLLASASSTATPLRISRVILSVTQRAFETACARLVFSGWLRSELISIEPTAPSSTTPIAEATISSTSV